MRLLCMVGALALIVLALADMRWGIVTVDARRRGLDVVFALDLSRSMLAEDVRPNRLERAKLIVRDVVERLPGDRVGLVGFAGDAVVACPLTLNHDAFRMSLDELDVRDAARGGSLLANAVLAAGSCFVDAAPEGKIVVVVSDGEDTGGEPAVAAAEEVRKKTGARVFTVGVGDDREGGRIPLESAGSRRWLVHEGREVWSKMEPAALTEMAKAGDGAFVPAGTSSADIGPLVQRLLVDSERRAFESTQVRQRVPRYQWFAGAALALLLIESLVGPARTRRHGANGRASGDAPTRASSATRGHGGASMSNTPRDGVTT
ncbi:MAG: VWA domain-containing protein [Phycisphaerales bacterium]